MMERSEKINLQARLEESVRHGDLDAVMDSIHLGAEVNLRVGDTSPLCLAIEHGHLEIFKYLLHRGANISFLDTGGSSELEPYMDTLHAYNLTVTDSLAIWPIWTVFGAFMQGIWTAVASSIGKAFLSQAVSAYHISKPLHSISNDGREIVKLLCEIDTKKTARVPKKESIALLSDNGLFSELKTKVSDVKKSRSTQIAIETVFLNAVEKGYQQVVEQLLDTGVDINMSLQRLGFETALYHASFRHDIAMIDLLLRRGARLDCVPPIEPDQEKSPLTRPSTALMAALDGTKAEFPGKRKLESGLEAVKRLIAAGADVNARDADGSTVLARAVKRSDIEVIQQLLLVGADPNIADNKGQIPLHLPVYCGSVDEIVSLLIPKTCNVNHRDLQGVTPLISLARNDSNVEAIKRLLKAGAAAEINAISSVGTALQNSTWWASEKMMGALLDAGADPNVVGGSASSALMGVASVNIHGPELIGFLLRHGADPRYADSEGKTALHVVIEHGASNSVQSAMLLLKYGANIDALWHTENRGEKRGLTPLGLAMGKRYKQEEVVRFLAERGASTDGVSEIQIDRLTAK